MSAANEVLSLVLRQRTDRDKQEQVGPSEVGGCRRRTWYRLNGQQRCNETLVMPAWMGTAIHHRLEAAVEAHDPFGIQYQREVELEAEGLRGHCDLYVPDAEEIIDWKTSTKSSLAPSRFPSDQQRWQVHLYGWLANRNDMPVKTVTLVGIPRDGDERHVVIHSEPYDESVAEQALKWLAEVKGMTEAPPPEKTRSFCSLYCPFYDAEGVTGCASRT